MLSAFDVKIKSRWALWAFNKLITNILGSINLRLQRKISKKRIQISNKSPWIFRKNLTFNKLTFPFFFKRSEIITVKKN
jgi:hypothetical protein